MRMDYSKITVRQIFEASTQYNNVLNPAERWVEAENFFQLRELIGRWFQMMEDGTANRIYPDPFDTSMPLERAEKMIKELDADFEIENLGRTEGKEAFPEYKRLADHAKIAFATEVFALMKTLDQIREETKNRALAGELLPPNEEPRIQDEFVPSFDEADYANSIINTYDGSSFGGIGTALHVALNIDENFP